MSETTDVPTWGRCDYCGYYHSYNSEMCRDMTRSKLAVSTPLAPLVKEVLKTIDEIDSEEDKVLANEGLESYAKGLAKEDAGV